MKIIRKIEEFSIRNMKRKYFVFLLISAKAEEFRFTQYLTVNVFHLRFFLRVFKACDKFLSFCSEPFRSRETVLGLKRALRREKERHKLEHDCRHLLNEVKNLFSLRLEQLKFYRVKKKLEPERDAKESGRELKTIKIWSKLQEKISCDCA